MAGSEQSALSLTKEGRVRLTTPEVTLEGDLKVKRLGKALANKKDMTVAVGKTEVSVKHLADGETQLRVRIASRFPTPATRITLTRDESKKLRKFLSA